MARQQFEFKAEMKQLLNLIVNSLYTNPEIFLRELVSNSSDALNKVRFMELTGKPVHSPKLPLQIKIDVDEENKFFTIEDTGVGMTYEDLTERLGTVASSGTQEFMEKIKEQKQKDKVDGDLIGQFGVGFYSAFMVTEEITVETRHANPNAKAWKWVSDGQGTYEIEETEKTERGTKISFTFTDEHKDLASKERLKQIIRKYSNFVDYSILVDEEEVNSQGALWHRSKNEVTEDELNEFYKFLTNDPQEPLDNLHLAMEGRMNFKALLFVPQKAKPNFLQTNEIESIQLYSNRVLVQEDCKDLLPEYLRFLEGVVDSEDLPLNISREMTQYTPIMNKIKDVLINKTLGMIEYWAESEPEKFKTFYKEFGALFKSGLNYEFNHRDRMIELLRFQSTKTGEDEMVSLNEYVQRMPESQKEIYYLSGESRKELERDPKLEYFRKKDIEVLLLTEPVDVFVVPSLGQYQEKPLKSIEKSDLDLQEDKETDQEQKDAISEDELKPLLSVFKEVAGDQVEDVVASRRLVDSPVTLTIGKEGMESHVEHMMKMMDQQVGPSKRVFEVNPSHPLIKNMNRLHQNGQTDSVKMLARQLYDGALLMQGDLESPGDFVSRMNEVMKMATDEK